MAKRYGFRQCSEPGYQNIRIRSCVNAPLKKREATTVSTATSTPGYQKYAYW